MKKSIFSGLLLVALSAVIFTACKKDDNTTPTTSQKANVSFYLTDDPANYDAVYIDIQQVEITMAGSAAVALTPVRPGVYNLLDFRNGLDTLLLRTDLPAGKVEQIRLILGSNNSVVVDGQTHLLNTPSAQQSGLKLNLHQDFAAGGAYVVWIDFDAAKSIVETGNGKYNLKPVIRAYSQATDGRIKGYVLPPAAMATVYASNGTETYAAIPAADGYYMFTGLPAGTYSVTYDASALLYLDVTLNNVSVTYGQTTDLGTTTLVQ
ncbi:MAG TPA: DUF4382 domain-containing protein [Flavipsychrobacter sp.]